MCFALPRVFVKSSFIKWVAGLQPTYICQQGMMVLLALPLVFYWGKLLHAKPSHVSRSLILWKVRLHLQQ